MGFQTSARGTSASRETLAASSREGVPAPIVIAVSGFVIILALVVGVGAPDQLMLRHVVQTLPFWAIVVLGLRRSRMVGWIALPCFLFWFVLMALIWLHLLGVAHVISGHFSLLEIAMTIVVGAASMAGVAASWRIKSGLPIHVAGGLFVMFAAIQWGCFRLSLLPLIAHR
jgi:hypothetical protein